VLIHYGEGRSVECLASSQFDQLPAGRSESPPSSKYARRVLSRPRTSTPLLCVLSPAYEGARCRPVTKCSQIELNRRTSLLFSSRGRWTARAIDDPPPSYTKKSYLIAETSAGRRFVTTMPACIILYKTSVTFVVFISIWILLFSIVIIDDNLYSAARALIRNEINNDYWNTNRTETESNGEMHGSFIFVARPYIKVKKVNFEIYIADRKATTCI